MSKYDVNIYTDGAAKGNPGKGGFGLIMEKLEQLISKNFLVVLDTQPITEWNF